MEPGLEGLAVTALIGSGQVRGTGDGNRVVKVVKLKVKTLRVGQVTVGSGGWLKELSKKLIYELQVS